MAIKFSGGTDALVRPSSKARMLSSCSEINFMPGLHPADGRGRPSLPELQFFDRYCIIGIDAHFAGNLHRFLGNFAGGELGVASQGFSRGLRVGTTAADGRHSSIGLDHVALPAEQ